MFSNSESILSEVEKNTMMSVVACRLKVKTSVLREPFEDTHITVIDIVNTNTRMSKWKPRTRTTKKNE